MRIDRLGLILVVVFILSFFGLSADSDHGAALNTKAPRADDWQYLVITSETFIDSQSGDSPFDPLMDRLTTGMTAHLQTTQSIGTVPGPSNPSAAVNLRAFIQTAVAEHGTRYVLLGGDASQVPVPLFWMPGELIGSNEDVAVPADIYYSCLDGTWNADGDDRLGEENDGADFIPDVAVGRLPAANAAEATHMVASILAYEAETDWPFRILQVGDYFYGNLCGGEWLQYDPPAGMAAMTVETLYDQDGLWDSTSLLADHLNRADLDHPAEHLISHLGAGDWDYAMKLWQGDMYDPANSTLPVPGLSNPEPFFLYSQADNAGDISRSDFWGKRLLMGRAGNQAGDHGAFAAVLHSGPAFNLLPGGDSASNELMQAFWRAVFHRFQSRLGDALMAMRAEQAGRMADRYYRWSNLSLNLLGCPYTALRWACPDQTLQVVPLSPAQSDFVWRQDRPVTLQAALHTLYGQPVANGSVAATLAPGGFITLYDDGQAPDAAANDGVFSAVWTPTQTGTQSVVFSGSAGGLPVESDSLTGEVLPEVHYTRWSVPFTWEEASDGTLLLDGADDETVEWPTGIPFSFPFYGRTYSSVKVSSNGVLFFEQEPMFSAESVSLPSFRLPHALVAGYWTDLWATPGHGVFVKSTGTSPNRHFIVQWQEVSCLGTDQTGTFQIVLEEASGDILFNFLDTNFANPIYDFGITAVFGVEDQAGTDGRQWPPGNRAFPAADCQTSFRMQPVASPAWPQYLESQWEDVVPGCSPRVGTLRVKLVNTGAQPAFGITAVLATNTQGVVILDDQADYGCILPREFADGEFRIQFPTSLPCEGVIDLSLALEFTDADGRSWNTTASFEKQPADWMPVVPILHNAETGTDWECEHDQGTEDWDLVGSPVHSLSHAWHAEGEAAVQDTYLISPWFVVPEAAMLEFYQLYDFEPGFDGGVVEIQIGSAQAVWQDLGPDQIRTVYNGRIADGYDNPLAGRAAWTGVCGTYEAVYILLKRYAGQTARIRFRQGSDRSTASGGWWIDDVSISGHDRPCPTVAAADIDENETVNLVDLVTALQILCGNISPGTTGNLNQSPQPGTALPLSTPTFINDLGDVLILANYLAGNLVFWN